MKIASRWFHYTNELYLCCYPSMPSWRGQGKLYLDLTYKRCDASTILVFYIKICRTCENWLTAEVTDLENDSFIFLAQFIVVVILMFENIRKKTDKKLCVQFLYNFSPRLPNVQWFGNRYRLRRVTIIIVLQWLSHFLLSISWNDSGRIDTAQFLLQVCPTNFLLL
jgi:hypothetical protein